LGVKVRRWGGGTCSVTEMASQWHPWPTRVLGARVVSERVGGRFFVGQCTHKKRHETDIE